MCLAKERREYFPREHVEAPTYRGLESGMEPDRSKMAEGAAVTAPELSGALSEGRQQYFCLASAIFTHKCKVSRKNP